MSNITFKARLLGQNNGQCDCCHELGNVLILKIPITKYFGSGKKLSTHYRTTWICPDCREKLTTLLKHFEEVSP